MKIISKSWMRSFRSSSSLFHLHHHAIKKISAWQRVVFKKNPLSSTAPVFLLCTQRNFLRLLLSFVTGNHNDDVRWYEKEQKIKRKGSKWYAPAGWTVWKLTKACQKWERRPLFVFFWAFRWFSPSSCRLCELTV